jgi:alpha-L-rhamnosidase
MLMNRYATLLGKADDARRFTETARQLKAGLNARFLDRERGCYDNGSQASNTLPLAFDMVPAQERPRVLDCLVRSITEQGKGHIGTGLVGGQWINRVLSAGGHSEVSYGFATNTTYPSWGYMAEKGATTLWELWNGDTAGPEMNSHNHVMMAGDLVIWLYESLAGIRADPAEPGFKHILMQPQPVGDLRFVRASHRSPYGDIRSEWRREGDRFEWQISVPPNASATVSIPARDPTSLLVDGKPFDRVSGVTFLDRGADRVDLEVGAGTYRFNVH